MTPSDIRSSLRTAQWEASNAPGLAPADHACRKAVHEIARLRSMRPSAIVLPIGGDR